MSFTSFDFILLWVIFLALYYAVPRKQKLQKYILLIASLAFYRGFGWKACVLLMISAGIAFARGLLLEKLQKTGIRKAVLAGIVVLEIGILIALKYVAIIRIGLHLVLPVGISFYTLSILGYAIDLYRNKYSAEKNVFQFLLYVMYFPHILQGPIARYDALSRQFLTEHRFDYEKVKNGAILALWGFIKKLVIADRLGIAVDTVYANIYTTRGGVLLVAAVLYSIQLYMDFSGCVDIACGVSETFGISLQNNFAQPYFARSIGDFWRRWHISLSSWFRDYVYIPLGGNRKGAARRWLNVGIVFALSGMWHGVGLRFLLWGMMHALYQVVGAGLQPVRKRICNILQFRETRRMFRIGQTILTFFLVTIAWIVFRVPGTEDALYVIGTIFADPTPWILTDGTLLTLGISLAQWTIVLVAVLAVFAVSLAHEKGIRVREVIAGQHIIVRWGLYLAGCISILLFGTYGITYSAASFIYMNF